MKCSTWTLDFSNRIYNFTIWQIERKDPMFMTHFPMESIWQYWTTLITGDDRKSGRGTSRSSKKKIDEGRPSPIFSPDPDPARPRPLFRSSPLTENLEQANATWRADENSLEYKPKFPGTGPKLRTSGLVVIEGKLEVNSTSQPIARYKLIKKLLFNQIVSFCNSPNFGYVQDLTLKRFNLLAVSITVSSLVKSHQNTHNFVNYDIIWKCQKTLLNMKYRYYLSNTWVQSWT